MTDPELDTAIDRAVRDLMNVDADATFRARLGARLERPARRTLSAGLLAALAATAAIVLAVTWMRPAAPGTAPTVRVAGVDNPTPAPGSRSSGREPEDSRVPPAPEVVRASAAPGRSETAPIPEGMLVAAVAEVPPTAIEPLSAIEPISVEPIATTPIATPEIVAEPLSPLVELQISPLEPRTARD